MPVRKVLPALAVALASSAAWGPPAVAAPGEGGGAVAGAPVAGQADPAAGGGAAYGEPAPKADAKRKARAKRRAHRAAQRRTAQPAPAVHRFPVAGVFDWGGPDARFGARRKGHRHQGQDLVAASGTPVVAPYRGRVAYVGYQAKGAGRYVVIRGADYDYVFMHLLTGSVVVDEGDRVRTGQTIAAVGSTGESTGPHLHFELWVGGWYEGGHPIDPLPLLQAWASPASS
jgi:murein DD-endopeptidase MepM/ murein hydrolase activator NlpD